ncbi:parathyroid hormone-related protein isoform X2 [Cebus imitator]|uniref:parathyroid hormone-related protein isoform X2 n=1 Tax=Cebus imitator TaxID=2715852 RepID=UPI00189B5616|nr:parathyroid hormone-related protein isoform X2 [Cebus imitator]
MGQGGGFSCSAPSCQASFGLLKFTGQQPASSPPRLPGSRGPRPSSLASSSSVRPWRSWRSLVQPCAPGTAGCPGPSARPQGPRLPDPRAGWSRQGQEGASGSAHAPGPGMAQRGPGSGVWLGRAPDRSGAAAREGGAPPLAARSRLGAPLHALGLRGVRSGRPSPPPPPARPPAPLLAPRAFLGRHLFATRSLLRQVCLGACEHSSARLSTRLQPAPPGQHVSPPVKRGCRRPAAPAAANDPPSPPPGPPDRRHTHLKLVLRVCGINFPEATSPPEEVDSYVYICGFRYKWSWNTRAWFAKKLTSEGETLFF